MASKIHMKVLRKNKHPTVGYCKQDKSWPSGKKLFARIARKQLANYALKLQDF